MEKKQICVIGGGAAGMMAAIMAARAGAAVTLLEHNEKTGRKLLATGNGRCNLTNRYQSRECYHSQKPETAWGILQQFSLTDTLEFFSEIGVSVKEKNGYFYPASMQASSVQELLEMEARYRKVKIKCRENVKEIRPEQTASCKPSFLVLTETWQYKADAVILACGSRASQIEGADVSGYTLAKSLGLSVEKPLPALVPLMGKEKYFSKWAGTRIEGRISLVSEKKVLNTQEGELQLTDYGISGIPVFQCSGLAARLLDKGIEVTAVLDFLPSCNLSETEQLLKNRRKQCPYKSTAALLTGLFPKKLCDVLMENKPEIPALAARIKEFPIKIKKTKPFENAQVCTGGVSLTEVHPHTLESRKVPGLYLAGELLDTDGICGGYNLQWAWTTGALAGKEAAKC